MIPYFPVRDVYGHCPPPAMALSCCAVNVMWKQRRARQRGNSEHLGVGRRRPLVVSLLILFWHSVFAADDGAVWGGDWGDETRPREGHPGRASSIRDSGRRPCPPRSCLRRTARAVVATSALTGRTGDLSPLPRFVFADGEFF